MHSKSSTKSTFCSLFSPYSKRHILHMIDYFSAFSKKFIWLKSLFLITTLTSFIVFGMVIFFATGTGKDIYVIPSIVSVLWSLICWLILAFFPNVPPVVNKQQHILSRLKNTIIRGNYYFILLIFAVLSMLVLLLTLKLLNVWLVDFFI